MCQFQGRELASIENDTKDYQHSALICHVETQFPHEQIARQSFLTNEILAFLPCRIQINVRLCGLRYQNGLSIY